MVEYSVVVPIYNEEGNILKLHSEIAVAMDKISKDYEVIYVNDNSNDNSMSELKSLNNVKIIELNKNYGQATALDAGFRAAKGEIIISMDGDGQNDPKDIPRLLKKMKDDVDLNLAEKEEKIDNVKGEWDVLETLLEDSKKVLFDKKKEFV